MWIGTTPWRSFPPIVAQAAEEIGKLVEPYLATFADFLASLDIQQRDNVAAEGDYPAVDHEISVTCTAEDLGRLFHTLADQMERDNALLPYIEQLVANTTVTFTSDSGETTRTTTTAEFFDGMREFADSLMLEDATLGILVGYNDDGLPFYFTAAQTLDDETVALYLQINPGETENATVFTLTMLEADDEGDLSDRVDADMTLVLDPADPNAFSVELNVQSTELNLYYAVTETAVTIEENLPGYKTTFSMTISEPDETSGLRIVYNGEGLTSLTATDGEKSTFFMTANLYDEGDDPIDFIVESGQLIEPGDGALSGSFYMNETINAGGLPVTVGFDTAVSSWAYDAAETAALQETQFEVATGEELAALQSRASERLQQKLFSLLSLIPAEFLELLE